MEKFNLQNPKTVFNFVFRLYNFVSLAVEDNRTLQNCNHQVGKLYLDVDGMSLPGMTTLFQKRKRDDDASKGPRKKSKSADTPVENEILSDVALMEKLERAGCTIPPEVDGFTTLLPVRVFLPCKGPRLTLAFS